MSREDEAQHFEGHVDYVRCGAAAPGAPHLFLSGGFDHHVHLWDTRVGDKVLSMDHGAPVEALLYFPSGGMFASAGGTTVKIWDMLGRSTPVATLVNHQKTVTSLCFDGPKTRLLSGSLDHQVKVYDLQNFSVIHSFKYAGPILSVAVAPANNVLAVGMVTGYLSIRRRAESAGKTKELEKMGRPAPRAGSYRYFMRGHNHKANTNDFVVSVTKKPKLRPYDRMLKKFKYHEALDAVFKGQHQTVVVISFLQELLRRSALRLALRGRDDQALKPLLTFLVSHVTNPRYTSLLTDVGNVILGK